MSWYNEMTLIVRHLINDLSTSPTYDDDRIEETIIVAAQLLIESIDFDNSYTIDIDEHAITPDPTLAGAKDDGFINLVCLKAATIFLKGEVKSYAGKSYRIVDGPSTIDVTGVYKATKETLDQYEKDLGMAIAQYKIGNSVAGKAILTPYTVEQINSRYTIF